MKNPFSLEHPLWMCGFRPFFLAAAASATLLLALWGVFLNSGLFVPPVPGGPFVWHAHELIFGFALAALSGFALTAIPEFTASADFGRVAVRRLFGLWLLGRISFWLAGWLGKPALLVAAGAHLGLVLGLIWLFAPRLVADPERKHLSFIWALLVLAGLIGGFYFDALNDGNPARWLHASIGLLMILIVMAMSRISMRIVNAAIDEHAAQSGVEKKSEYRARPPKRNLAIFCIAAYSVCEFFAPGERLGGWLALAAAAALFHLQSDWHIGRPLLRRWPLMLFAAYLMMAAGYLLIGLALLGSFETFSAGRHLLTVGAIGGAVYIVLSIAGRMHCGKELDEGRWLPGGAALIALAAVLRAATALPAAPADALLSASSVAWISAFALWLWKMAPLLSSARADGGQGCEGIIGAPEHHH